MRVKLRLSHRFYCQQGDAGAVGAWSRTIYRKTMHEPSIGEGGING